MKKRGIRMWWLAALVALAGCAAQSAQPEMGSVDMGPQLRAVRVDSPDADVADAPSDEALGHPPSKPKALRDALKTQRAEAIAAERKLFMTSRLDQWLQGGSPSMDRSESQRDIQLKDDQFASLDSQERLAYCLLHPEDINQNCLSYAHFAGDVEAICRRLPDDAQDYVLSERQMNAVRKDSNAIKKLILNSLEVNKAVSVPMMRLIVELKFRKTVPALIGIYEKQSTKDDLVLTTMVSLMERCNFWSWIYSPEFKAMVVDDNGTIPLTPANVEKVLAAARKFSQA